MWVSRSLQLLPIEITFSREFKDTLLIYCVKDAICRADLPFSKVVISQQNATATLNLDIRFLQLRNLSFLLCMNIRAATGHVDCYQAQLQLVIPRVPAILLHDSLQEKQCTLACYRSQSSSPLRHLMLTA